MSRRHAIGLEPAKDALHDRRDDGVRAALPAPRAGWGRWLSAVLLTALVLALNGAAWRLSNPPLPAPDVPARVAGLAYNAFGRWDSPLAQRLPEDASIDADFALLARHTSRLRTYGAAELPALPALAERHGLHLTMGVWLDRRADNNRREIDAAVDAARRHTSVQRLIVGNETQLHGMVEPKALYDALAELRRRTRVPVSTAEPWHVWLAQPELARHVDFVTVHLLPYWEGVDLDGAIDEALRRLREVRARFPDKPVVVGEIGWPSHGATVRPRVVTAPTRAIASPETQARFVRGFLARPEARGLDYFVMEAIDQPWKRATEGAAGAYWGLWHADRTPKFAFAGPVERDPWWRGKALVASLLGAVGMLPFLAAFAHLPLRGRATFAVCVQAVASFAVLLGALPLANYLRTIDAAMLVLLVPALGVMAAILLAQAFEFAELRWPGGLRRREPLRVLDLDPHPAAAAPFVSIHLPCSNEPPEQVIATIDSLLALDWPGNSFEVIVVDNNTRDEARWRAVQAHVDAVNAVNAPAAGALHAAGAPARPRPAVRFVHLPTWPGYKAGALNVALEQGDPRTTWVAVVDADYVVEPRWLRAVGAHLQRADVAVVQAPQAHRGWQAQRLSRWMNWEFDGFFRLGMHHRHERDAIIMHGTMVLVRRAALVDAGGWSTAGVCEDTELGLRLLARGWRAVYVDEVLGRGLVPADFAAYARQRTRWAQGGMQILRQHARTLLGTSRLTAAQRYHFVAGWLPWLGDALHLVFTLAALAWSLGVIVAPTMFGLPIALFVVPLVVFFAARVVAVPLLYRARVPCSWRDVAGACVAGMGLSHAIARGVFVGLAGRGPGVFEVTARAAAQSDAETAGAAHRTPAANAAVVARLGVRPWRPVREELALLGALALAAVALPLAYAWRGDAPDAALAGWWLVLALQGVPYAAALICARVGRPREQVRHDTTPAGARADTRGDVVTAMRRG